MNGIEALRVIKESKGLDQTVVIMYSTSSNPENVELARHLGANCYYVKPSDYNEVKLHLREFIERDWTVPVPEDQFLITT